MSADGKLARDNRALLVDLRLENVRHRADDRFGRCPAHLARGCDPVPQPLDEELAVGVQHDLDDAWVVEGDAELISKGVLELADQARQRVVLVGGHRSGRLLPDGGNSGMISIGPQPPETLGIGRENSRNAAGLVDHSRVAETIHGPSGALQDALEPHVGSSGDLVVAACHAPLDDPGEHGERRCVQRAVHPSLFAIGIDTETGAFDHPRVRGQSTAAKELRKNRAEHRCADSRKETCAADHSVGVRKREDIRRRKFVELVIFATVVASNIPRETSLKDAGSQAVHLVNDSGFRSSSGVRNGSHSHRTNLPDV